MNEFVKYAAKAVAALVTPWVLFAVAWLVDTTGVELAVEPGAVETAVVSVVTSLLVYLTRNAPKPPAA